jgi:competence ComEA-like helix-hairpin-helix protein
VRTWLNKYFGFSKGEFNGLLFLVFIIIALKSIPIIYTYIKPVEVDPPDLIAEIKRISITEQGRASAIREDILDLDLKKEALLFSFDPNTLPQSGWETLGLSPKQAKSIVNYTSKGGRFYQPEDLKKMYTISPEMYNKLLPYVKIVDRNNLQKNFVFEKKEYAKKAPVIVDINHADSVQLDAVKGIGPAFAKRILKYRERLGGFYKKEQLLEVYGLDSAKYAAIKDQLVLSKIDLKTININTATFNDLRTNPYLSYKQINAILQFRKQHGDYASKEDLKKIVILNPELIEKISPYISFK